MFKVLSRDHQQKLPAKTGTTDVGTISTTPQPPSDTQLTTIQNEIASMTQVIMTLSNSIQKMDKLDQIDVIESHQKSSEARIIEMVTNLCSELEQLKATSVDIPTVHTPSYADARLKTSEKSNKNVTRYSGTTTALDILKPVHETRSTYKPITPAETCLIGDTVKLDDADPTPESQTDTTPSPDDNTNQKQSEKHSRYDSWSTTNKRSTNTKHKHSSHSFVPNNNTTQVPIYSPMDMNQETDDKDDSTTKTTSTLPMATHKYWKIAVLCKACGLIGHSANKCYRRGFKFLPRDIQRHISTYNTKYGDTPNTAKSDVTLHKHILPAPETKLPERNSNVETTTPYIQHDQSQQATIRKHQHVLPTNSTDKEDIEFLSMINMEENTPTINVFYDSYETKTIIQPKTQSSINPLSIDILTNNGEVHIDELHTLQDQLMQPTPLKYFTPYQKQDFHVDTGTNVHATTDKKDFLMFYPPRKIIRIAAGQTAHSEGYDVMMVQLFHAQPPLPLALVYYCLTATTGTLSPQCSRLYNKCRKPTHCLFEYLSIICP